MRRRGYVPFFLILVAAAATLVPLLQQSGVVRAFAQERKGVQPSASDEAGAASLVLGTVASPPGTTATIPLYYKPLKSSPLRALHLEVEFVSNSVQFATAEKGLASKVQDFDLAVETKELAPDDKQVQRTRLSIDVSVLDSDPKKALPEGLWAFLNFRVSANAKPFAITLHPTSLSARDATQKPIQVVGEAGKIIVPIADDPMSACFFFNH